MDIEQIIIRQANVKDLHYLLEFEQGIILAERPFDITLKEGRISYYNLEEYLTDEQVGIFVAEYNSKIIASGYAQVRTAKPYLIHEKYVHLGFMYVVPIYRGKGINQLIMNALKHWSSNKGIKELRLEVYAENDNALKAYRKIGFKPHMLEMRIKLEIS